ncbi:dolichyl-phosphate-mannose-protein mannosyltransferase [Neolewinella xylanilytica]|uniref:Dolichyl-phosphate-mannose-protein mannosyltransferase n=1 Tax=Neolewinella xylanilytica TaxID=1514080 RepID=A0A2S6I529_9BACT|nr:glycosyltransferase family 39 protein [Neolewinella xylanilytica]PPK86252.1 dolichyl-phosphate-mannose-protein mannosyltransferase [Neolewinella xylanilytica]
MGRYLLLALVALVLLCHHLYFFYGHFGADDMTYAKMAYHLYRGEMDFTHPFTFRIVPIFFIGLSYQLFGVNDLASALPAMLCSLGVVVLLVFKLRRESLWMALFAVSGYFGMRWNFFYSDKLMADVYVSLAAFGAWVVYLEHRKSAARGYRAAILAAALLFIAFNAKGSIILLAPLFVGYMVVDFARKKLPSFWVSFLATSAALLGLYLLGSQLLFGSALTRFEVIEQHRYLNPCSYDQLPLSYLIDRLTLEYWALLVDSGFVIHGVISLTTLLVVTLRGKVHGDTLLYPLTSVLCLLSINFMTISFDSYNPVCRDPRHIIMFAPILSVCSAYCIATICASFSIATDALWFRLLVGAACILLLYPSYKLAEYSQTLRYPEVRDRLTSTLTRLEGPAVVYGSRVTKTLSEYVLGFEEEARGLRFVDYLELPRCEDVGSDTARMVVHTWYTDWHAEVERSEIDSAILQRGWSRSPHPLTTDQMSIDYIRCAAEAYDAD